MTDEQAMWRVQKHDDAGAFARLVKRWEPPIRRLCTRMTGDVHRAEDLTQDFFRLDAFHIDGLNIGVRCGTVTLCCEKYLCHVCMETMVNEQVRTQCVRCSLCSKIVVP